MNINHIGDNTIHTPCRQLQLIRILHVSQASRNIVSVHRLASNNNVFLEFHSHPHFFCIKDLDTRSILLKGPCRGGIYPLPSSSVMKNVFRVSKMACRVVKPSLDRWHNRLGHSSIPIVQRVIKESNLPCLAQEIKDSVCNACQQAKSHQLPYTISTSISKHPLKLVFQMFGVQLLNGLDDISFM
jgi:hypothetical protein